MNDFATLVDQYVTASIKKTHYLAQTYNYIDIGWLLNTYWCSNLVDIIFWYVKHNDLKVIGDSRGKYPFKEM